MESYTEKIVPVEMETSGIRAEIHTLAEGIKLGFDTVNLRFEKMHEEMNLRFEKMDQKMDFIRESLEKQITSTKENLELQIRADRETNQQKFLSLENHLKFHEKLLYTIIGLMVTLSIAVVVKILLI